MKNYQKYYGCEDEKPKRKYYGTTSEERGEPRGRFMVSMNKDLLSRVDNMSEILHASRPDVIEIMVAFYFSYVSEMRKERLRR